MSTLRSQRGFTVAEIVIVIALLGILAALVALNFGGSSRTANELALQSHVQSLRGAIEGYEKDHGRYPCSDGDHGYPCTDAMLRTKLTSFSDQAGRTASAKSDEFVYGPYLERFPAEPFSQRDSLTWSLGTTRLKETIADHVDSGTGNGGWYYEPETGNVIANLGSSFPSAYARF